MASFRGLFIGLLLFFSHFVQAQTMPKWSIDDLVKQFSKKSDTVYVVNFWATFCKPCVEELPYLQSISKKYEGQKVKLILVSLDLYNFYPDKIALFAKKNNITADIVWLNETNADHFCPKIDPKWSGSIPATLFINPSKGYKKFFEDQLKPEVFESELRKALGL